MHYVPERCSRAREYTSGVGGRYNPARCTPRSPCRISSSARAPLTGHRRYRGGPDRLHREQRRDIGAHLPRDRAAPGSGRRGEEDRVNGCRELRRRYPAVSAKDHKNVGSVRFELTIDGSLRHASVLQRVIIRLSADPLFITCKDRWSPSPFRTRPRPPSSIPLARGNIIVALEMNH